MVYRWTFGKDPLKLEKIFWGIHNQICYNRLWRNDGPFVKPAESCPNWLKITLSKELDRLVQKYRIATEKNISPIMRHTLLMIYIEKIK